EVISPSLDLVDGQSLGCSRQTERGLDNHAKATPPTQDRVEEPGTLGWIALDQLPVSSGHDQTDHRIFQETVHVRPLPVTARREGASHRGREPARQDDRELLALLLALLLASQVQEMTHESLPGSTTFDRDSVIR